MAQAIEQVLPGFRLPVGRHGDPSPPKVQVYRACLERGLLHRAQVAPNTFSRLVSQHELLRPQSAKAERCRLAFSKQFANQMWQADTMHGPFITGGKAPRPTRLMCFIDDASRVIPHGEFFFQENAESFVQTLKLALYKRGIPDQLYTDHGAIYVCRQIEETFRLNRQGKMIAPIIDDAHLLQVQCLRKLRLLFEEFPKNHNLILFGQSELLAAINLGVNEDIRSRVTYSVVLLPLAPDEVERLILGRLDRCGLGHHTFSQEALSLIVRSSEGIVRKARNLCLGSLIQAVLDQTKTVGLTQVNQVLIQPHWRKEHDLAQN